MEPFTEKVVTIIQHIPEGKVMTYGQIAKAAGNPRGARQVARILHSLSRKYHLPWHRVVNVKGEISFQGEEQFQAQKLSLEAEGIKVFKEKKVDLNKYRYSPDYSDQKLRPM